MPFWATTVEVLKEHIVVFSALGSVASVVAATAAWLAARSSARSVLQSRIQMEEDATARKIDRTFAHSPYRTTRFHIARMRLQKVYPQLKIGAEIFDKVVLGQSSDVNYRVNEPIKEEYVDDLVMVANMWGQMASEHKLGLLDEMVAREVLRFNFMKFCHVFDNWLRRGGRDRIYNDSLILYEEWLN
ncbi:MAG: hypothetical protein JKY82_05430 [Rhizobiaceae bacterium]|nr:hypothetical protein [Rhizobiaceae bacterium]